MQASIFMRCSTRKTLLCSNSRGPTGRWVSGKMGGQSPVWCLPKESLVVSLLFSVTKFCPTLRPQGLQHTRLRCPSLSPRVCSHSCPLSGWYYLTITSGVKTSTSEFCCCSSVTNSCLILCDPMDCSTPGSSVFHYLPEFAHIHVH